MVFREISCRSNEDGLDLTAMILPREKAKRRGSILHRGAQVDSSRDAQLNESGFGTPSASLAR